MNINLENRLALVTSGTSELGRAICQQLVESGARVVCLAEDSQVAASRQELFSSSGLDVKVYAVDITDHRACGKIINRIESESGDIDIIINNCDFMPSASFTKISAEQWQRSVGVNLDSVYNLCRQVSDKMAERGFGRVINISSMYARKGDNGKAAYAAAKAGVHGFTMALSQELARKGVTVNTVSPGHIYLDTATAGSSELNELIAEIPAQRMGQVEEVASLVDFLCSSFAGFITGSDIPVNGGQYIY